MPKCPNCGQPTARTGDWACPWCGYPLLSRAYKKIPKSYRQLQEERLQKQAPPPIVEIETLAEPETEPAAEREAEPAADTETANEVAMELEPASAAEAVPEPEAAAEPEAEPAAKPRAKRAAKPKAKAAPKPKVKGAAKPGAAAKSEPETTAQAETEITPEAIEITVEELLSAYVAEGAAADAKFVNKILKVTGVVDRIEIKEDLGIHYINLTNATRDLLQNVRCVFEKKHVPELNSLTRGQTVTIQGRYDGSIMDIRMKDCALVH